MFHLFQYNVRNFLLEELKAQWIQYFSRDPVSQLIQLGSCQQANPMWKFPGVFVTIKVGTYALLNFKANPNEKKIIKSTYHPFLFCLCVFSRLVVIQVPFQQQQHSYTLVCHFHAMHPQVLCNADTSEVSAQVQFPKCPRATFPLEPNFFIKKMKIN